MRPPWPKPTRFSKTDLSKLDPADPFKPSNIGTYLVHLKYVDPNLDAANFARLTLYKPYRCHSLKHLVHNPVIVTNNPSYDQHALTLAPFPSLNPQIDQTPPANTVPSLLLQSCIDEQAKDTNTPSHH